MADTKETQRKARMLGADVFPSEVKLEAGGRNVRGFADGRTSEVTRPAPISDELARLAARAQSEEHHAFTALTNLITHIGEKSGAAPDWPAVTGSAEDIARALRAVDRMAEEIQALTEAHDRMAETVRSPRRPSALAPSIGAAIHDEQRIEQIVLETVAGVLESIDDDVGRLRPWFDGLYDAFYEAARKNR